MYSLRTTPPVMQRQSGAALMVMLVIMIMGITAFLVSSLSSSALKNKRDETTASALAQAKTALIGHAITYYDTHSVPTPQTFGFLPCPDPDGDVGLTKEGSSQPPCDNKNISTIGRLPWKTLGLPVLRDGNGECLWYAVAGTYKNNPDTDFMDWDTNGLFQVMASAGVTLTGATPDTQAVAVIFSPGVPLNDQGQNRAPDGNAPICGGNYTASNYLDSDATISANNSSPSAIANAITQFFASGATANINDRIIYITKSDIFNAIKKRNDFASFITTTLLPAATSCLSPLPYPVVPATFPYPVTITDFSSMTETQVTTSTGSVYIGRIPSSALTSPSCNSDKNLVSQWRDNLLYAACTSSGCLNGGSSDGVVIFAGEKTPGQQRITNMDKNTWSNYLEDTLSHNTFTDFTNGNTTLAGDALYAPSSTSTDVSIFIP